MVDIVKRNKALSVSPLKTSQTVGGALAFLGMDRSMPLMHGSQGCTAFAKVFFVRHYREPIPLQTTAMDQVSSVMGADENIIEALATIAGKSAPDIIGLVTTGLAETQGCDILRAVSDFRKKYPEYEKTVVIPVNTPDFSGSFETGYALAVKAILKHIVPDDTSKVGLRKKQVNILCGANLSPGDLEFVTESIESFGLQAILIPDLSGSLDGHLEETEFNPLTTGGTSIDDIRCAGENAATLVIGQSMFDAATLLSEKTGVPDYRFGHLTSLETCDRWFMTLAEISGQPVAHKWTKQRSQLQDAMLDTHFMIGDSKVAIASDPDLLLGFDEMLSSMGARTVCAVIPSRLGSKQIKLNGSFEQVKIGDFEDAEKVARDKGAQILLGNSYAVQSAARLNIPILRMGFPQYDLLGGFQRCWFGYRGIQQALFDVANLLVQHHDGVKTYKAHLSQKLEQE
ncbi:MAG: nitrogenase iron-molybdenum cofactor biosynthesis protein NifN [Pseudomonadota bacterium]